MRTISFVSSPFGRESRLPWRSAKYSTQSKGLLGPAQIGAVPVEMSMVGVRSGRFVAVVSSCRKFARPRGMRNPTDVLN